MSLLDTVVEAAQPNLDKLVTDLPKKYLDGLQGTLEGLTGPVRAKVEGHLDKAADFKWKAIKSADEETRRAYAEGAADEMRRAKTVLTSEATAISNEQAETLMAGFMEVLETVGSAAKAALTAVVSGLASGAIKGLMGGEGAPDMGAMFPGLG